MSVIIKKTIFGILAFGLLTAGFAQTTSEDSQIELPDLTTVVSGSNDQEDFAPVPDFEDVLDMTYTSGELVPVLPSISEPLLQLVLPYILRSALQNISELLDRRRIFMPKEKSEADILQPLREISRLHVFTVQILLRFLLHMNLLLVLRATILQMILILQILQ